jgi:hypothetical protein
LRSIPLLQHFLAHINDLFSSAGNIFHEHRTKSCINQVSWTYVNIWVCLKIIYP